MRLCQKCVEDTKNVWVTTGLPNIEFTRDLKVVPESKCEFWIHHVFNKLLEYQGWRVASDIERDALFAKMKAEAPDAYKVLVDTGAAPP